jgi:hypothetical protein
VGLGDLLFFAEDDPDDENTGHRPIRVDACRDISGAVSHWETLL